jgi:hypothetical protein
MVSNSLHVAYQAFDASRGSLTAAHQALGSIASFELSQERTSTKGSLSSKIVLSASPSYTALVKKSIVAEVIDELNCIENVDMPIPIQQCRGIVDAFHCSKSDYVLTLDSDTVFLRSFVENLVDCMNHSGCDISAALECGSTGFRPYANYNCGFLLMKRNRKTEDLLNCWLSLCEQNFELAKYGNQRLFPHALGSTKPRVFTIDNIYNLRCHPVFGGISQVWSPVFMVHNHDVSDYWYNSICSSLFNKSHSFNDLLPELRISLEQLDLHFTPSDDPYRPRYVSSSFPFRR